MNTWWKETHLDINRTEQMYPHKHIWSRRTEGVFVLTVCFNMCSLMSLKIESAVAMGDMINISHYDSQRLHYDTLCV